MGMTNGRSKASGLACRTRSRPRQLSAEGAGGRRRRRGGGGRGRKRRENNELRGGQSAGTKLGSGTGMRATTLRPGPRSMWQRS